MPLIDKGRLLNHLNDVWLSNTPNSTEGIPKRQQQECIANGIAIAMACVEQFQPIDAVPVTRCRDCTRHKVEVINGAECWRCPLRELDVRADYYCADAIKEEDHADGA